MRAVTLTFILLISTVTLFAQLTPQVDSIPMSDGKKLTADVYIPSGMSSGPVILIQTPYNRLLYRFNLPLLVKQNINNSNYIFVILDWRGFYGSKKAAYTGAPKLGEDGYDAVEWIAQQSWCNGKIGTWGASALGRVQFATAQKNPPHLTCICPLVAGPQYTYEEYFPGGCLRTEYLEQLDELGFGLSPVLMNHTVYDIYWMGTEALTNYPDSIQVPALMIGGWYDHTIEQMLSFFSEIQSKSPVTVRDKHHLMIGPWVHKGVGLSTAGELSYSNAEYKSDSLALQFFDFYLRDIPNGYEQTPAVQFYQMGENNWLTSSVFPPGGTVNTHFYFHGDGSMDNSSSVNPNPDSLMFHYNPTDPSPTIGGPTLRTDLEEGPYDQAPQVENRNDILTFSTEILSQNIVMQGSATVHLKISSDRKDTDFNIRLTDVYPDGRSMLVNDGVIRMRFRNGRSVTDTAAMVPGKLYDADIILPNTCITFMAGHRIRVDVTSSNYPRFNRNANTGGNMYPGKNMDSLRNPVTAANTVYLRDGVSYITMPLAGYTAISHVQNQKEDVTVYPNPAGTQLIIMGLHSFEDIEIVNLLGQKQQWVGEKGKNILTVDTSGLPEGVYILHVQYPEGKTIMKKFIKIN